MRERKVPLRKCTGCGEMKEKKQLVRIVRTPDNAENGGAVLIDRTGKAAGRGAYVCNDPQCLVNARKGRRLEKAFSCRIPDEIYEQLEQQLKDSSG